MKQPTNKVFAALILMMIFGCTFVKTDFSQTPVLSKASPTNDIFYNLLVRQLEQTETSYAAAKADFEKYKTSRESSYFTFSESYCPSFAKWYKIFQDKVALHRQLVEQSDQKKFTAPPSVVTKKIRESSGDIWNKQAELDEISHQYKCSLSAERSDGTSNPDERFTPDKTIYFEFSAALPDANKTETITPPQKDEEYKPISKDDATVIAAGNFALAEARKKDSTLLKLNAIQESERQLLIKGTNYRLCVEINVSRKTDDDPEHKYFQTILFYDSQNHFKVTYWALLAGTCLEPGWA